ncbi:MAG: hypothetical protein JW995_02115 [Melioribacteraceae bacterium]|nr:hypothetical protein [Melioribacteraceae bacterium]
MNLKSKLYNYVIWGVIAVLVLAVLIVPVKVPHHIQISGKILPARQWLLIKSPDGNLITSMVNYIKGVNENYTLTQFERGDAVKFKLNSNIYSGRQVVVNDTIGTVYSNETEKQLIDLKSELTSEKALLKVSLSNEKEAVVKSEEQRLEYARKQLEEQEKLFIRQKALHERDLISQEEYDIAEGAVNLFKINVDIAEEMLKTVTTGAKEEEIDFIKSRIDGLSKQINVLEKKFSDFVIQSPVNGIIERIFSSDTLLIISDTTEFLCFFPVMIEDAKYLRTGLDVVIESSTLDITTRGILESIDKSIQPAAQNQYLVASARITDDGNKIIPGLNIEGYVKSESKILREYIWLFIRNLF